MQAVADNECLDQNNAGIMKDSRHGVKRYRIEDGNKDGFSCFSSTRISLLLRLVITSYVFHLYLANNGVQAEQHRKQEQAVFVYEKPQLSATESSPLEVFGLGFSPAAGVSIQYIEAEIFSTTVVPALAIDRSAGNCPAVYSQPAESECEHRATTSISTQSYSATSSSSRPETTLSTSIISTKPCNEESITSTAIKPLEIKMSASTSHRNMVLYFTQWAVYGRKHFAADLPADKISHVLYSFANVDGESGKVTIPDSWADTDQRYPPNDKWDEPGNNVYGITKQLFLLKKKHRNLKVLLSIGGWTYSSNFRSCNSASGRSEFAESSVQLLKERGFDGIDIDWEYPKDANEAQSLVDLLKAVRAELDAYSASLPGTPHFALTIAAPAGAQNYEKLKLREMAEVLDFINLMAYDYAGTWDGSSGHQANLFPSQQCPQATPFSTDAAVKYYLANGVPSQKLVLGMPLYGRAFTGTDGAGCGHQGGGEGSWEQGVWDFKVLPRPGSIEHHDPSIGASWSYDPNSKLFVTYDTKPVVQQKIQYILDHGLGGAMWWESSADKPGDESLINTVYDGLKSGGIDQSPNVLDYPESKYDNLKNKFGNE